MDFPVIVWRGEVISHDFTFSDGVTSASFYATGPNGGRFSKQLRAKPNEANVRTLNFTVADDLALGEWRYQIWTNLGRKKVCCFNGQFTIAPSLANQTANAEQLQSDNERYLAQLEASFREDMLTGAASWTIAGNTTTRYSLNQKRREIDRVRELVNLEREEQGRPPLFGTPDSILEL